MASKTDTKVLANDERVYLALQDAAYKERWERRFWPQVTRTSSTDECWPWMGPVTPNGYVFIRLAGTMIMAHRALWLAIVGPIPLGLVIDHTCHNADTTCPDGVLCFHRRCMNFTHYDCVSRKVNAQRGHHKGHADYGAIHRTKTHCPQGHPYNEENTYVDQRGWRQCKACGLERSIRWRHGQR